MMDLGGVIQVQVSGMRSGQAVMQGLRQIGERRSLRSMDFQAYLPFREGLGRP